MIGIVLVGPPCSGKSTLGKEVARRMGLDYISSGDIARMLAEKSGTEDDLNAGNMADEDSMRATIKEVVEGMDSTFILDGFPRFKEQYEWAEKYINCDFHYIVVHVPLLEVVNRSSLRCRCDDKSINTRYSYFINNTVPMINSIDNAFTVDNSSDYTTEYNIKKIMEHIREVLQC